LPLRAVARPFRYVVDDHLPETEVRRSSVTVRKPSLGREQAMYAVRVRLRIDPSRAAAAAAAFSKDILPRVLSPKGFVRGYWLDPVDGEGFGFVLFETEDQARGATPPASDWSAPGVTILGADVARVAVEVPQP